MPEGPEKPILDYATPSEEDRPADPRRMFFLLLPAGIFMATFIGSWRIASYRQDDRNFMGACVLLVAGPLALVYGVQAIRQATRRGGLHALARAAAWNLLLVGGVWLVMELLIRNNWFR